MLRQQAQDVDAAEEVWCCAGARVTRRHAVQWLCSLLLVLKLMGSFAKNHYLTSVRQHILVVTLARYSAQLGNCYTKPPIS